MEAIKDSTALKVIAGVFSGGYVAFRLSPFENPIPALLVVASAVALGALVPIIIGFIFEMLFKMVTRLLAFATVVVMVAAVLLFGRFISNKYKQVAAQPTVQTTQPAAPANRYPLGRPKIRKHESQNRMGK